jgi:uncharacterized protein YbaR (Trm112 family)
MLTCPRCGEASISRLRVLMPSFGSVVTCPACKTSLRNTSRRSVNYSVAVVLSFVPLSRMTDQWWVATVVLLTVLSALSCYLYVRFLRLEPITVELDPEKWTQRRALRSTVRR